MATPSEGDMMAVAVFCLEQARQAIALFEPPDGPELSGKFSDFHSVEAYVLKLGHVYESCCALYRDRRWPAPFTRSARRAATTFIHRWKGTDGDERCEACEGNQYSSGPLRERQAECHACREGERRCRSCGEPMCNAHAHHRFGKDLRNVLAHYEEVLSDPRHRHRGEPLTDGRTVRGVQLPAWWTMHIGTPGQGPDSVDLVGKSYQLDGVHEALVELEREFSAVLTEPDDPWSLREGT